MGEWFGELVQIFGRAVDSPLIGGVLFVVVGVVTILSAPWVAGLRGAWHPGDEDYETGYRWMGWIVGGVFILIGLVRLVWRG